MLVKAIRLAGWQRARTPAQALSGSKALGTGTTCLAGWLRWLAGWLALVQALALVPALALPVQSKNPNRQCQCSVSAASWPALQCSSVVQCRLSELHCSAVLQCSTALVAPLHSTRRATHLWRS